MGVENVKPEGVYLLVWNPLYRPDTIAAHAHILKECIRGQSEEPFVYWGKISRRGTTGKGSKADATWDRIRRAMLGLKQESPPLPMVFVVTDYNCVHALRVVDVLLKEDLRQRDLEHVPDYYRAEAARLDVPFWLKVSDIQLLCGDQFRTLDFLCHDLKFDPYSSERVAFPRWVKWGSGVEVFDYHLLASERKRLFVELEETVSPRTFDVGRAELRDRFGSLWDIIPKDQLVDTLLVSSLITYRQLRGLVEPEKMECGGPVTQAARAVEELLVHGILKQLRSLEGEGYEVMKGKVNDFFRSKDNPSLGEVFNTLGTVGRDLRQSGLRACEQLCLDGDWRRWFAGNFLVLRNDASHRGRRIVLLRDLEKMWLDLLGEGGPSRLRPVLEALSELEEARKKTVRRP